MSELKKEKPDYAGLAACAGLRVYYVEVRMCVDMMVLAENEMEARMLAEENFHEEVENQEIDGDAGRPVLVTSRRQVPQNWQGAIPYVPETFQHDGEVEDYLPPDVDAGAGDGGDGP